MKNKGFSTIELLVTLFVATAFLLTGYQLYSMIISDSGATKAQSKANNYAYDLLQQYKAIEKEALTRAGCSKTTFLNNDTQNVSGLSNVKATATITCPYTDVTSVAKVEIKLTYGNDLPQKSVTQATYVNK